MVHIFETQKKEQCSRASMVPSSPPLYTFYRPTLCCHANSTRVSTHPTPCVHTFQTLCAHIPRLVCTNPTPCVHTFHALCIHTSLGLASILGREIIKYTVIYSAYIRFWPTQHITPLINSIHWSSWEHTLVHADTHTHVHPHINAHTYLDHTHIHPQISTHITHTAPSRPGSSSSTHHHHPTLASLRSSNSGSINESNINNKPQRPGSPGAILRGIDRFDTERGLKACLEGCVCVCKHASRAGQAMCMLLMYV